MPVKLSSSFWSNIKMDIYHFMLIAVIVGFVGNEYYRSMQLEAQNNIDIQKSKLYREMKKSLEADRDQVYAEFSKVSAEKYQAEREIYQLKRSLEMEREKLRTTERDLSRARAEMERLNRCTCLCSSFEAFGFCTRGLYRMATYYIRKFVGSNLLLTALDYVFDLLEPQSHRLLIE